MLIDLNQLLLAKLTVGNQSIINEYINSSDFKNLSYIEMNINAFSHEINVNITVISQPKAYLSVKDFVNLNFTYFDGLFNYLIVSFIFTFALISSNRRDNLLSRYTIYNYKFLLTCLLPFLIETFLFIGYNLAFETSILVKMTNHLIVILVVWFFLIIFLDHFYKIYSKREFFNKQKNIRLLLETRLGTYSPK